MPQKKSGFTLVEIMIVVAIVGLLAALAVPNILRTRINSNEAMAKGNLKTYSTALENFRAAQNPPSYPPDLQTLSTANPNYVDAVLGSGVKGGYVFAYNRTSSTQFQIVGTPVMSGITGVNTFFVNESGVIRFNDANGNPIE